MQLLPRCVQGTGTRGGLPTLVRAKAGLVAESFCLFPCQASDLVGIPAGRQSWQGNFSRSVGHAVRGARRSSPLRSAARSA